MEPAVLVRDNVAGFLLVLENLENERNQFDQITIFFIFIFRSCVLMWCIKAEYLIQVAETLNKRFLH